MMEILNERPELLPHLFSGVPSVAFSEAYDGEAAEHFPHFQTHFQVFRDVLQICSYPFESLLCRIRPLPTPQESKWRFGFG
jgi:hypothetical protein